MNHFGLPTTEVYSDGLVPRTSSATTLPEERLQELKSLVNFSYAGGDEPGCYLTLVRPEDDLEMTNLGGLDQPDDDDVDLDSSNSHDLKGKGKGKEVQKKEEEKIKLITPAGIVRNSTVSFHLGGAAVTHLVVPPFATNKLSSLIEPDPIKSTCSLMSLSDRATYEIAKTRVQNEDDPGYEVSTS